MREAKLGEAGSGVGLITAAIRGLLRWGAMVGEAVRLHHQAERRPPEIDPVAVDDLTSAGHREPRSDRKWNETAFELGVGQAEGVAGECVAQDRDAGASWELLEERGAGGLDR